MRLFRPIQLLALTFALVFAQHSDAVAGQIGVLLMHGKGGTSKPKSPVGKLKSTLESDGFIVLAPDMPWSRSRFLEQGYEEAMAEIDDYVAELTSKGATKIVVGGHSIGANAAIGYGARREGLAGVLAIAPGHIPDIGSWKQRYEFDVADARDLVAAGKSEETLSITDVNQGKEREISLSAKVVVSWYAPDAGAVMPINAANLKSGTPLMWIIGEKDRMYQRGQGYAFDKAPPHPKSRYEVVKGGHKVTPQKGENEIIDWLRSL